MTTIIVIIFTVEPIGWIAWSLPMATSVAITKLIAHMIGKETFDALFPQSGGPVVTFPTWRLLIRNNKSNDYQARGTVNDDLP